MTAIDCATRSTRAGCKANDTHSTSRLDLHVPFIVCNAQPTKVRRRAGRCECVACQYPFQRQPWQLVRQFPLWQIAAVWTDAAHVITLHDSNAPHVSVAYRHRCHHHHHYHQNHTCSYCKHHVLLCCHDAW